MDARGPTGSPVRPGNSARKSSGVAMIWAAPRGSNHAMIGANATPSASSSTPASAMPDTASATMR